MPGPENFDATPDIAEEVDSSTKEGISRRGFFGRLAAAALVGTGMSSEGVEAAEGSIELEFVKCKPTKHEQAIIIANLKKIVPEAVSMQVTFTPDENLSSVQLSILTASGDVIEASGAGVGFSDSLVRALDRIPRQ